MHLICFSVSTMATSCRVIGIRLTHHIPKRVQILVRVDGRSLSPVRQDLQGDCQATSHTCESVRRRMAGAGAMLAIDPDLQAPTLWKHLQSRFPGRWHEIQHRSVRAPPPAGAVRGPGCACIRSLARSRRSTARHPISIRSDYDELNL